MPTFTLNATVIPFYHRDYGTRLLFQHGSTNPRDELGKNGVTIHGWFASLFYRTITMTATSLHPDGSSTSHTYYMNRRSLLKYLGQAVKETDDDATLVEALKQHIQHILNAQAASHGGGLRHAGRYNQRVIKSWFDRLINAIRASFLGWLYQATISGLKRIRARFLFVNTEKDILEAGETLAFERMQEAYRDVPAYQKHVVDITKVTKLADAPITSKSSYIKIQTYDSDTHLQGKYPRVTKTDTSTGTTGKPTEWVRGEPELTSVKHTLELAAKIQFGDRRLCYINAFAFGPWATGLTTYELMRTTGSVFATGPDKEKIVEKLVNIHKDERHQLDRQMATFKTKHPELSDAQIKQLTDFIDATLHYLLTHRENTVAQAYAAVSNKTDDFLKKLLKQHHRSLFQIAEQANQEKQQIILTGYPPFLKDIVTEAQKRLNIEGYTFKDLSVIGIVGGQAISEAMRDQLIKDGFHKIYSSYGASDLDINLGIESDYEISVRKIIENNQDVKTELFGKNKGLPMVFHYDPMNYHVECDDTDELIFTCARNDRSSPRIRYDVGDKGRVISASSLEAVLEKHRFFLPKPRTNLQYMFIWGRDAMVIFRGANLEFTELERAITNHVALENISLKKAFYKVDDDRFEIWVELKEGVAFPSSDEMSLHARQLFCNLAEHNQDFRWQLDKLQGTNPLPTLRFYKHGQSPISDAGGHRKQVLIFEKGVNLDQSYSFPDEAICRSITLNKADLKQASATACHR